MSDLEGLKTRIEDIENDVMVNKSDNISDIGSMHIRLERLKSRIEDIESKVREIENRINYRGPLAY